MTPTLVTPGGGNAPAATGAPSRGRGADATPTGGGGFADALGAATAGADDVDDVDVVPGEAPASSSRGEDVAHASADDGAEGSAGAGAPAPPSWVEVRQPWSLPAGWSGWSADAGPSADACPSADAGAPAEQQSFPQVDGEAESTSWAAGGDTEATPAPLVDAFDAGAIANGSGLPPHASMPGSGSERAPMPAGSPSDAAAAEGSTGVAATPVPSGGDGIQAGRPAAPALAPASGIVDAVAPEDGLPPALDMANVPSTAVSAATAQMPQRITASQDATGPLAATDVEGAAEGGPALNLAAAADGSAPGVSITQQTPAADEIVAVAPDRSGAVDAAVSATAIAGWQRATTFDGGVSSRADAALPPPDAAAVVDQVVKSLRMQWRHGVGEARIQLRPEHLGPVDIAIRVDGGAITAVVRAESTQVQEWILSHQQSLRQQLEAAGLRLDALVVSPDDERRQQSEHDGTPREAPRRRRHAGEHAPIFEVVV